MINNAEADQEKEKITELRKYIINNWKGVEIYSKEAYEGSCTEGHVSHVLSDRLSSRPMGWSKRRQWLS